MDKIIEKAKVGDFIILLPERDSGWHNLLDVRDELEKLGYSVVLLDRFINTPFKIIPEEEMNKLGWYKHE